MKCFLAALLAVSFGGPPVWAQVSVSVDLDQKQYLVREAIVAAVRIVNFSGQTLELGRTQEWLTFDVEAADSSYLAKLGDPPVLHAFDVPNAARATRRVDIAPFYDLTRSGRFKVIATVRVPELGQEITSEPAYLNIITGSTLWQQLFGWHPEVEGERGEREIRKYSLLQAMNGDQIALYARVSDPYDTQVFSVKPIGRLLTFSKPEAQLDRTSRLHVLWQTGAHSFSYYKLDPHGQMLARRTYQYTSSRPRLWARESGEVEVIGGARIPSRTDFPPPETEEVVEPDREVPALPGDAP